MDVLAERRSRLAFALEYSRSSPKGRVSPKTGGGAGPKVPAASAARRVNDYFMARPYLIFVIALLAFGALAGVLIGSSFAATAKARPR